MPLIAFYTQETATVCLKSLQQAMQIVTIGCTMMLVTAEEAKESVNVVQGEHL